MSLLFLLAACVPFLQHPGGEWWLLDRAGSSVDYARLGATVANAGDVNFDGKPELVIGAPGFPVNGQPNAGRVTVAIIRNLGNMTWGWGRSGNAGGDAFGHSAAGAGRVNGDLNHDVLVGAPGEDNGGLADSGGAYLLSGADGTTLWHFSGAAAGDQLGYAVAGAGDLDNDGIGDLLVGAVTSDSGGLTDNGAAFLYSGATGLLIRRFDGAQSGERLGHGVANAGDVDGDGYPDQLLGAPGASPSGKSGAGAVLLISGANGALLRSWAGETAGDAFGAALDSAGDADGDGVPDQLAGAAGADPGGLADAGRAYLFSGASGSLLARFDGLVAGSLFGFSVTGAGDVDGDGRDDVAVGAPLEVYAPPGAGSGSVSIYSGLDGTLLYRNTTGGPRYNFQYEIGWSVEGAGDVIVDGRDDVAFGIPGLTRTLPRLDQGTFYVTGLEPYLEIDRRQLSAAGGLPLRVSIRFPNSESGYFYVLLASTGTGPTSLGGVEIPLSRDALFQRILAGNPPSMMFGAYGILDQFGDANPLLSSHPALGALIGSRYYLAAVSYDRILLTGRLATYPHWIEIVP